MKVAGCVVAKKLGFKTKLAKPQELEWKKIIEDKVNSLRMDFTRLDWWNKDELYNEATMDQLINRYKIEDKGLKVVIKELKQSLVARSSKLRRN